MRGRFLRWTVCFRAFRETLSKRTFCWGTFLQGMFLVKTFCEGKFREWTFRGGRFTREGFKRGRFVRRV